MKFKMTINNTITKESDEEFDEEDDTSVQVNQGRFLVVTPKLIELSMFKIFKDDDEQFLEEMLF